MLNADTLRAWQADPVSFAQALILRRPDGTLGPPMLSDRQASWLRALAERDGDRPRYRTVGIVGPKRCGKTLISAFALLWKSLGEDRRSVCLANSRESAQSLGFDQAKELLERGPLAGLAEVQRGRIAFPSLNTEVLALPCSARTVAGITIRGGLLVSDELWAADDPEPWRLLSSQTEGTESQALLVSQASGSDSDVYRLWQASQEGAPGLWFDYVGPEIVEAEGHPNVYVTQAFLEERRAALPEALFRQYFLGEWGSEDNAFLSAEIIAGCDADFDFPATREAWETLREGLADGGAVTVVGMGLDRALPFSGRDDSVIVAVAMIGGVAYVVGCWRLPTGAEHEVLNAVVNARAVFGGMNVIAETYQCADIAPRIGAELRHASTPAQVEMFSLMSRLATEGRLKWPRGAEADLLREQVGRFRIDTSSAQPKFSGGSGKAVDDAVFALGWALQATEALANFGGVAVGHTTRPGSSGGGGAPLWASTERYQ